MESLHANQAELFEALTKITINIKKDSADRKTSAYFKRRLETLEAYWADYKYNHDRRPTTSRSHTYFTNRKYEQAEEVYKKTKVFINQQYQDVLMRSKMEQPSGTSGQQQQSSYQVINNTSMATIVPIADYVAINLKKDSYSTISIHDIKSCLSDTDTFLCYSQKPIYHFESDEKLCEPEPGTG
ncbi:unnamed protein product [Leptidea sinapis]|uniref:Uncharacterized protein n=1 Tax=Leptidea sinapis TaxID=189913 RepID=A0A5E4R463_9NEOP|nr:unnamed protein product [Leptidea sinapis]